MPGTPMLKVLATTMPTPIGPLTLLVQDGRVCAGGFTSDLDVVVGLLGKEMVGATVEPVDDLGGITEALGAYFGGDVSALDRVPVAVHGASFQERVWVALRQIPPGQPTTYRELAVMLGSERLARAVGLGCATNRVSPIIPCHRVTGTSGSLTGYYWGLDRKRWLLDHEKRHVPSE